MLLLFIVETILKQVDKRKQHVEDLFDCCLAVPKHVNVCVSVCSLMHHQMPLLLLLLAVGTHS